MSELIAFGGVGNMGNPMAQNLVKAGKKVKVLVKFRGRENRHKDLGMTLLKDVISKVDNGSVEKEPMINNNLLIMVFKPAG